MLPTVAPIGTFLVSALCALAMVACGAHAMPVQTEVQDIDTGETEEPASAPDTFSVMTFNVRHRNEAAHADRPDKYPWQERSGALLETVVREAPDVVALQELNDRTWVGRRPSRDSVQSLFREGLRAQGDYRAYMNAADSALFVNDCDSEAQDSVKSRTPKAIFFKKTAFRCLRSGSVKLPGERTPLGEPVGRYASWVVLQRLRHGKPTSHKYFVLNTHLAAGDEEDLRMAAVGELVSVVRAQAVDGGCLLPVIVAGDLNARPDSAPVAMITRGMGVEDSYDGLRPTSNAWGSLSSRIDYVLHSPALEVKDARVVAFSTIVASDHLPLKATFAQSPAAEKQQCERATRR